MKVFKHVMIAVLFMSPVVLMATCGGTSQDVNSTPASTAPVITDTTVPPSPIRVYLNISALPVLGENVELIFTVNINELWKEEWQGRKTEDLARSRAWIQFFWADIHGSYTAARKFAGVTLSDVSASGDLTWEGNALENRNITLQSSIQIPREGVWKINGYFSTNNWEQPVESWLQFPEVGLKTPILVWKQYAIADGTAVQMFVGDFKKSLLGYLSNFDYGMVSDKTLNDSSNPVIIQLDISKPPMVGEEATLTCTITALYDEPDFFAQITFLKSPGIQTDVPLSDFLVSGDLEWQGDLKSQTPVTFSAIIKFPEEGEWQINAFGNSLVRKNAQFLGFTDGINITITKNKAYYGWKEIIYTSTVPPTPVGNTTTPTGPR
jgi:hypothetical protein